MIDMKDSNLVEKVKTDRELLDKAKKDGLWNGDREDGQVIGGLTAICIGYYLYLISAKVGLKPAQSTWAEMLGLALLCFVSFFLGSMYEHISLPSMTAKVALLAAAALWVRLQWAAHFEK